MQRFVRNGGFALLVLAFAGCGDATGPHSVVEARILWASRNLTTYTYIGTQTCFCTVSQNPVRVDVVNGTVSSVFDLTTNAQVSTQGWLTVEELFDLADNVQPEVLEFDWVLGFPRRLEHCCLANDSGFVYTVSSLFVTRID